MSIEFPQVKPSGRRMRLGRYPVKTYRSMAGTTVKRSYGNKAYGYELSLTFANRRQGDVRQIVNHYDRVEGGFERFTLPAEVFAGVDTPLRTDLRNPSNILWEYAEPPDIDWARNAVGVATVTVTLIGELDV